MKKNFGRIMIVVLMLVVLGTVSAFAAEEKAVAYDKAEGMTLQDEAYMTAATLDYNTSAKNSPSLLMTDGGSTFAVYPVEVKAAGKLFVDVQADGSNQYGTEVVVGVFDGSQISYYGKTGYVSAGSIENSIGGYDVNKGTYYIGVKSTASASVAATAYVIPYGIRTLSAGKVMIASGYKGKNNDDSEVKFKIKPTKSGYITVALNEYGYDTTGGYVTLLNSKKKAVSDKLWYYSSSDTSYVVFGVKKGTTYYLKVTGCQGSSDNAYAYGITYSIKAATLKSNTSKGKAVSLKRKAKAKAFTRQATGKAMKQWYKIKVPKKQATVFSIDATAIKSGSTTVTCYYGKKKIGTVSVWNGGAKDISITYGTTYGKANKGTYYFCVASDKKTSGMYKVRYKK